MTYDNVHIIYPSENETFMKVNRHAANGVSVSVSEYLEQMSI